MTNLLKKLEGINVVPVVTLDNAKDAVPLAIALQAGGINAIELTLRTEAALDGIRAIKDANLGILLGVGTVINKGHVKACAEIGVDFIVTPGTTPTLIKAIAEAGVPAIPGISTTGEAVAMIEAGYDFVKFFPAEANGGIKALRAIGGPLTQLKFMPTGGINQGLVRSYLDVSSVVTVGGSWVADKGNLADKNWDAITENAKIAQSL
ncbi:bifunctional 4-hydroxy-2-oxoglutarate aldolase/2-dehydro-3-deoxy-phosphogluconate aldolase [Litorimonas haliclonae]|uniref:bifunctional 4-hydroxy-2-oxoglutarate aldolase/2-dehydro-3-deoxy-phosphogluconate aldolase n=1 Tax=Litorimonas haliclonae TaxID=2081977 RepID=UPI0039F05D05